MCSESAEKEIRRLHSLYQDSIIEHDEFKAGKARVLEQGSAAQRNLLLTMQVSQTNSQLSTQSLATSSDLHVSDTDISDKGSDTDGDYETDKAECDDEEEEADDKTLDALAEAAEATEAAEAAEAAEDAETQDKSSTQTLPIGSKNTDLNKFTRILGQVTTKALAKEFVNNIPGQWAFSRGVSPSYTSPTTQVGAKYDCSEHVDCQVSIRFRPPRKGETVWVIESNNHDHTSQLAIQDTGYGVPKQFRKKVLNFIDVNEAPARILAKLQLEYRGRPELATLDTLPTLEQISNLKKYIVRKGNGDFKLETVADLKELTQGYELRPTRHGETQPSQDQLVVLPDGVFEGDVQSTTAFGFCFSTPNLLENAVRAMETWGPLIPIETDGSWKFLYCGWPILAVGTHHIYYSKKHHEFRQKFRPISFMFTRGESEATFTRLFTCTISAVKILFQKVLDAGTVCSDKSDSIRAAFIAVWPNATWITCWPHIALKPHKKWVKYMVSLDKTEVLNYITSTLTVLHLSRSTAQFDHVAKLFLKELMKKFKKETKLAQVLDAEYLSAPYNCWHVTASGEPGVLPSSQNIESYWKSTKSTKIDRLRARLDNMMGDDGQIHDMLWLDGQNLCGPIDRFCANEVLPSQIVEKACTRVGKKGYKEYKGAFYASSSATLDTPVTVACIKAYEDAVQGTLPFKVQSVEEYAEQYMRLHKVVYDDALKKYVCDCKGYWHTLMCSHELTKRHVLGEIDVLKLMESLPVREKSGRKRKVQRAWVVQGPSPVKKTASSTETRRFNS